MADSTIEPLKATDAIARIIRMERMGSEHDIAGSILHLASKSGVHVSGNVLVTGGGQLSIEPSTRCVR